MPGIIAWLLGLLSAPTWLVIAAQAAWEIISLLPWFKRPPAIKDLHGAIAEAKVVGNDNPIKDWHQKWNV